MFPEPAHDPPCSPLVVVAPARALEHTPSLRALNAMAPFTLLLLLLSS